jgi:hypothetical protein
LIDSKLHTTVYIIYIDICRSNKKPIARQAGNGLGQAPESAPVSLKCKLCDRFDLPFCIAIFAIAVVRLAGAQL